MLAMFRMNFQLRSKVFLFDHNKLSKKGKKNPHVLSHQEKGGEKKKIWLQLCPLVLIGDESLAFAPA